MITPKELVGLLPPTFDPDYIDGAVVPYLLSSQSIGERPVVPLIDLALSKENAAPPHFWGMLYDGWAPNPEEEGVTVFIQGYEHRGPDNERKKIYASATTPDLYAAKYAGKFRRFLSRLFDDANAGKPLMERYYANYFDLYWDPFTSESPVTPSRRRFGRSVPVSPPSSATGSRPRTSCVVSIR